MKRNTDSTGLVPTLIIMLLVWLVVCLVTPERPTPIYNNTTTTGEAK